MRRDKGQERETGVWSDGVFIFEKDSLESQLASQESPTPSLLEMPKLKLLPGKRTSQEQKALAMRYKIK